MPLKVFGIQPMLPMNLFIEGSLTITPDGGKTQSYGPGDGFVVDAGFKGVWEIKEPVKKHFVIKIK